MRRSGFSLVELSIVLVILGLLVGGVMTAQSLIRAAELRSVTTQYDQIRKAVGLFRDQYNGLPGDIYNATEFWGKAANCYAAATGKQTCNGNGSGALAYKNMADTSNVEYEPWHFWRHLGNAELISGSYSGYSNNTKCTIANQCLEPGVNGMSGPVKRSGWVAFSVATYNDKAWQGRSTNRDRNILALGIPTNQSNGGWGGNSLSAAETWNIDQKIDDGKPYTGKLVDLSGTHSDNTPKCATKNSNEFNNNPPSTTTLDAEYRVELNTVSSTEGCVPFFDLD